MSDPNYPEVPPTAATPPAPPAPPPSTPVSPFSPPTVLPEPEPMPTGRRFGGRAVAVALGVVALGGGAAFALSSFGSDGAGAATPEEAGRALVAAIADEDILGVVDLLPAGERELLRDVLTSAQDEYQRLGVLSEQFRLDGFPGVDIAVEDLELDVDEVTDGEGSDDGIAMVTVTGGDVSVSVDGDRVVGNLGEVVESVADARDVPLDVDDVDEQDDAGALGAAFAVVEEDGRWHPSLLFTIAESARRGGGFEDPDFGDGITPEGAESPEAAIQALLDAAVELDAEAAIALLDPGEARALQVYSQFFLPLDTGDSDFEATAELTDVEIDSLGDGVNRVVPTGFEVRFEVDGGRGEIVFEDGCTTIDIQPPAGEGDPVDQEVCVGGEGAEAPESVGDVAVPDGLRDAAEAFLPLRVGVVTVERDGQHFVAPVRTLADLALGVTRGLERADLEEGGAVFALLAGELDDELESFFDELTSNIFGFDQFEDFEDFEDFETELEEDPFDDGFDDESFEESETFPRSPTGARGPNGELVPFDAVSGELTPGGTVTFTALADADGEFLIGAQGADGLDTIVRVLDPSTGEELAVVDDTFGFDPEARVFLQAGQAVAIEVRAFSAGDSGGFVLYFEPAI